MPASAQEVLLECISHAAAWLSDDSHCEIRCVEYISAHGSAIQDASLTLASPFVNLVTENDVQLTVASLHATLLSTSGVCKEDALLLVKSACAGTLQLNNRVAALKSPDAGVDIYSESLNRDRWLCPLRFRISGERLQYLSELEAIRLDDSLRFNQTPFDGVGELSQWLQLKAAVDGTSPSGITVTVWPPVELIFSECFLNNSKLHLKARVAAKASLPQLSIAVRLTSGSLHNARMQVADGMIWEVQDSGQLIGSIEIPTDSAVGAQVLVGYAGRTFVRQWFWDPSKSPNPRYRTLNQFDPDLKSLKQLLLSSVEARDSSNEAREFEKAVGCIAYLLGLSTALPLQNNAPDLVSSTPRGRHLVVECTLSISDFSKKLGKLVDRCNALKKSFAEAKLTAEVIGVLVCRLPRDQIALREAELQQHQILLATRESLEFAVDRAWQVHDPDALLDAAVASTSTNMAL